MKLIWILVLACACLAVYFVFVRPKLRAMERFQPYFALVDNIETGLWAKIRAKLRGWWVEFAGFLALFASEIPDILQSLGVIDYSAFLDDTWAKRVTQGIILLGIIFRSIAGKRKIEQGG